MLEKNLTVSLLCLAALTAQAEVVNRAMAQLIGQCPQQYLWGYTRYKTPRALDAGKTA